MTLESEYEEFLAVIEHELETESNKVIGTGDIKIRFAAGKRCKKLIELRSAARKLTKLAAQVSKEWERLEANNGRIGQSDRFSFRQRHSR